MIGFQNTIKFVLRILKKIENSSEMLMRVSLQFSQLQMLNCYIVYSVRLNAPKFAFLSKKFDDWEFLKFKIGAFKDKVSNGYVKLWKSLIESYTTSVLNFIIIRYFKPSNAPFL